jgi:CHAT domain-containing protein/tetratricopeptide (TPR) repeat protein
MPRFVPIVFGVLGTLLATPVPAEHPPQKLAEEDRNELVAKWRELNTAGLTAHRAGRFPEATKAFQESLEIARRLYPKAEFPDGHIDLATSMNNLADLHRDKSDLAAAEPLFRDALEMRRRLFTGDHANTALGLNNLATLYLAQGKLTAAEPLFRDALDMYRRLYKEDHPHVAGSLNNLAALYLAQGNSTAAEPLYEAALDMFKRLFKGDHPRVAGGLNNLAALYRIQGKLAAAGPLFRDALEMRRRLFTGDHPDTAESLNNLAALYCVQDNPTAAGPLFRDALEMRRRLFTGDHPATAQSLSNLAALYRIQGKLAAAEPLYREALDMFKRLIAAYAEQKSEGEALTLASSQPLARDAYLSVARIRAADPAGAYDPATAYPTVWATKGTIARVYEQRQLRARAAAADPALARKLSDLADTRRRHADLLLTPATKDPGTLKQRDADLKDCDDAIASLNGELSRALPTVARIKRLDDATLTDLQNVLPADAALVDYFRYMFIERGDSASAGDKEKRTARYLAFVATRDKVAWVDLDTAASIEPAVNTWLGAITGGREIPAAVPARVRELVWNKVREQLPATIRTLFICPDFTLCRLPFAALPGDKPSTILIEEYAIATIPHAPFLLDRLRPQDALKNPPTSGLVVGGVRYDAHISKPDARASNPPVKPGATIGWGELPNTVGELNGVATAALRKKLSVTRLDGEKATTSAVLQSLPNAKVAHFATHGFFADPSFRGTFRLDEKDYEKARWGERVGKAVNSPLVMTGLVCAGANNEQAPGRGIVTGEALVDLDLSGLELAVLSACETGIGDVEGGEGVFGLQRAFHYAGTKNVVASLWKVPDAPTAALMSLFYRNLWDKDLPPVEALRQAQLHVYRNPESIPDLATRFRGTFQVRPGPKDEGPADTGGKAHPLKWAAFTLSGTGR